MKMPWAGRAHEVMALREPCGWSIGVSLGEVKI